MTPLQRAILRTVAYYDVFSYPLTAAEIRRWLYPVRGDDVGAAAEADIMQAIAAAPLTETIGAAQGFYFLRGREAIVQTRGIRAAASLPKWTIARDMGRWLHLVPFVTMVAVVNTLAIDNAREDSDIDYLVVTTPGRLWLTRLLVTGLVQLQGRRRHGASVTNRICLSFYVTDDALDLSPWRLDDEDHYFLFWMSQAVPLIDDGTYARFREANPWVAEQLPHAWEWDWHKRLIPRDPLPQAVRRMNAAVFSLAGASLESLARAIQRRWMAPHLTGQADQPGHHVVISDAVLKFHEADRREQYRQAFHQRLKALGILEDSA